MDGCRPVYNTKLKVKAFCVDCVRSALVRRDGLKIHMAAVHGNTVFMCVCGKSYKYRRGFRVHRQTCTVGYMSDPIRMETSQDIHNIDGN